MTEEEHEMLELAAKAAGAHKVGGIWVIQHSNGEWHKWMPLDDDGDALRLAVALCLAIRPLKKCVFVESDPETLLAFSSVSELEMYEGDPCAAARLAIVKAAADIGRAM